MWWCPIKLRRIGSSFHFQSSSSSSSSYQYYLVVYNDPIVFRTTTRTSSSSSLCHRHRHYFRFSQLVRRHPDLTAVRRSFTSSSSSSDKNIEDDEDDDDVRRTKLSNNKNVETSNNPSRIMYCYPPPSHEGAHTTTTHASTMTTTTTTGEIPPPPPLSRPIVRESIRSALVGVDDRTRDTGMSLVFLGTSAGLPSRNRNPSSTLIRLGGRENILIDVGEGTQRQLMFTSAKLTKISRILITHLHGDHIFGLPGLLLGLQHAYQLQQQGKTSSDHDDDDGPTSSSTTLPSSSSNQSSPPSQQEQRVVKLYGPPGLYNYIASNIIFSCTLFHSVHIEVTELVGGRVRRIHGGREVRNPFEVNYPEFNFGKISRRFLPCGPDGIWTIEDLPPHLTREDILSPTKPSSTPQQQRRKPPSSRSKLTGEKGRCRIQAAEVDHLSGVVTFGYSIEEEDPPRNIDAIKAKALGVSPVGRKYNLLKAGFSVWTDDGSREVQPNEVLIETRKRSRRKVAVVGDNRGWTAAMKAVAKNSDLLVHEATLTEKDTGWRKRGHSTAKMAGQMSGEVNAQLLVLNHISPKTDYVGDDGIQTLIQDAQEGSNGKSDVLAAHDFMEIVIPWTGFHNTTTTTTELTTVGTNEEQLNNINNIQNDDDDDHDSTSSATNTRTERSGSKGNDDKPLPPPREVLQNWFGEPK